LNRLGLRQDERREEERGEDGAEAGACGGHAEPPVVGTLGSADASGGSDACPFGKFRRFFCGV
jgi:hypothetical protein